MKTLCSAIDRVVVVLARADHHWVVLTRRFDRNKSKLETRAQRLGFVGTVTTKLYGVKIKAKPNRRDEYHLKREKPFQIAW